MKHSKVLLKVVTKGCTSQSTAHIVPPNPSVGSQLVNALAVRRHHDPMDLVSLARDVQQADQFVRATTAGKLQVVVDQIRMLQEQV